MIQQSKEVFTMILKLDFASDVPIYQQIRNQIVLGVADGLIKPGEQLPTIRALADEAGVNTMTVNKAYALLKQEGVIIADRRSGARVRGQAATGEGTERARKEPSSTEHTQNELRLVIAEAKLSGMDRETFLKLCEHEFDRHAKTQGDSDRKPY